MTKVSISPNHQVPKQFGYKHLEKADKLSITIQKTNKRWYIRSEYYTCSFTSQFECQCRIQELFDLYEVIGACPRCNYCIYDTNDDVFFTNFLCCKCKLMVDEDIPHLFQYSTDHLDIMWDMEKQTCELYLLNGMPQQLEWFPPSDEKKIQTILNFS